MSHSRQSERSAEENHIEMISLILSHELTTGQTSFCNIASTRYRSAFIVVRIMSGPKTRFTVVLHYTVTLGRVCRNPGVLFCPIMTFTTDDEVSDDEHRLVVPNDIVEELGPFLVSSERGFRKLHANVSLRRRVTGSSSFSKLAT